MKKKRQELGKLEPLTVIDLKSIGTPEDPCFGKGYDLSTKECKLCGDSELCAFSTSQALHITRAQLEKKNNYKDLDVLEDTKGIKKYIRNLKRKGLKRTEIIQRTSAKFEVPSSRIRTLYIQMKHDTTGKA